MWFDNWFNRDDPGWYWDINWQHGYWTWPFIVSFPIKQWWLCGILYWFIRWEHEWYDTLVNPYKKLWDYGTSPCKGKSTMDVHPHKTAICNPRNHTKNFWTWTFIVYLSIKNGDARKLCIFFQRVEDMKCLVFHHRNIGNLKTEENTCQRLQNRGLGWWLIAETGDQNIMWRYHFSPSNIWRSLTSLWLHDGHVNSITGYFTLLNNHSLILIG